MEKIYSSLDKKISKLVQTQTTKLNTNAQFYPRVVNKTNIPFTDEELKLLNKGLKYNLSHKRKHWLSKLALEAEAAITLLHTHEQEYIRYQVAHNLRKLYRQHNEKRAMPDKTTQNECRTIHQIKKKVTEEKAIITKADKGNSIVILYIDDYNRKVDNFISNNSFTLATWDITNKLQRDFKTAIEACHDVIPRVDRWRYKNLKPTIPTIRGLVKIHKDDYPIRPVIDWKNATA
jgi:hypothetical protein